MNNNTLGHQAAVISQHSHNVKRCVKRSVAKEPHWRISNEEARRLFEMGVFNATTYLLAIVKSHGGAGWKWSFRVADFCKEYGFQRSTFYCALSKLRAKHLIFWSGAEKVTVWWQDIGLANSSTTSGNDSQEDNLSSNGSKQDSSKAVQIVGQPVQIVGQQSPETSQNQGLHQPSRFSSDFSSTPPHPHPPHPLEEEEKIFQEKEEEDNQSQGVEGGKRNESPHQEVHIEVAEQNKSEGGDEYSGGGKAKFDPNDAGFIAWMENVCATRMRSHSLPPGRT